MMEWINVFGAVFIVVIMVPNIVYAVKCRDGFENKWSNKGVEIIERIGRFGCFGFMVVNIPGTWFGSNTSEIQGGHSLLSHFNYLFRLIYCICIIAYFVRFVKGFFIFFFRESRLHHHTCALGGFSVA